jgi:hypothetical protein
MANLGTHNITNLNRIGVVRVVGLAIHDRMLPQSGMAIIKADTDDLGVYLVYAILKLQIHLMGASVWTYRKALRR